MQSKLNDFFKIKGIKISTSVANNQKLTHPQKSAPTQYNKLAGNKYKRSDEDSGTQVMESDEQLRTCPQLILITALDTVFSDRIINNIQKVLQNYNKTNVVKMIAKNAQFHGIKNVQNLIKIDNEQFWQRTMPLLLKIVEKNSHQVCNQIQMLTEGLNKFISINKFHILILLGQMFLCIMPKQTITESSTFGHLMCVYENERDQQNSKAQVRLQKLKCIINYFNISIKQKLEDKSVQFYRTVNCNRKYLNGQSKINLVDVEIKDDTFIEDYYGQGIMIDFANKHIGGGVLNNGAVQEEIMFITFPQLIISKLICEKMEQNEAIIIYGADRYSTYTGYASSFKFKEGYYFRFADKSVIVAIDAENYSIIPDKSVQYSKKHFRRQIHKAVTGFEGANCNANEQLRICTGLWGCGAFSGNEILKFLIQWVACSEANRKMVFMSQDDSLNKQLRLLVSQFQNKNTSDLFGILDQYWKIKREGKEINLLDYIKDFV